MMRDTKSLSPGTGPHTESVPEPVWRSDVAVSRMAKAGITVKGAGWAFSNY